MSNENLECPVCHTTSVAYDNVLNEINRKLFSDYFNCKKCGVVFIYGEHNND